MPLLSLFRRSSYAQLGQDVTTRMLNSSAGSESRRALNCNLPSGYSGIQAVELQIRRSILEYLAANSNHGAAKHEQRDFEFEIGRRDTAVGLGQVLPCGRITPVSIGRIGIRGVTREAAHGGVSTSNGWVITLDGVPAHQPSHLQE